MSTSSIVASATASAGGSPLEIWQHVADLIEGEQWPGEQAFPPFLAHARRLPSPLVLELGVRQAIPGRSTRHDSLFPHATRVVGTDLEPGSDVDLVADVHRLTEFTGCEAFDIIFTESGFEHFKYPQLAAHEIMKALRPGGIVFVQTNQTFPIHAVPYDYFRFSKDALASLFTASMGMRLHAVEYASPAAIYSRVEQSTQNWPAWLHVNLYAEKVTPTPDHWIYDYDCLTDGPASEQAA
jgi:SAM-dependent methyltransferase